MYNGRTTKAYGIPYGSNQDFISLLLFLDITFIWNLEQFLAYYFSSNSRLVAWLSFLLFYFFLLLFLFRFSTYSDILYLFFFFFF